MILRHSFTPADNARLAHLCGSLDEHLRAIETAFAVRIGRRAETVRVDGPKDNAEAAMALLQHLYQRARKPLDAQAVQLAIVEATRGALAETVTDSGAPHLQTRRADLAARTPNQARYLEQIVSHDLTIGIGPAGTGKTFLAVACAVDALLRSQVQRIVLTRPAVEAGERLGFLPGDLTQKVDPYLRPLYDALYDLL
ncbi:MAG: PhoH family protein, partial [Aquabacterium sp.]